MLKSSSLALLIKVGLDWVKPTFGILDAKGVPKHFGTVIKVGLDWVKPAFGIFDAN